MTACFLFINTDIMFLQSPLTWPPGLTLLHLFLAVSILHRIRVIFIKISILCIVIHNIPWTMTKVEVVRLPWPIRGLPRCSVPKEFNMRRIVEYIRSSMKKFQETQHSIKAEYKGNTSAVDGMHRQLHLYWLPTYWLLTCTPAMCSSNYGHI